jgi:hypothetical protein
VPSERFLIVTDTPGIKQFVFGTDALAEVRGASALLDRLNRSEENAQQSLFRCHLPAAAVLTVVFARGGTGQFIVKGADQKAIERALWALANHYSEETGGEVRIVWGVVSWPQNMSYQDAAREAHFQMRLQRETASDNHAAPLLPLFSECSSSSHLPAGLQPYRWGGESLMISESARRKREESRHTGDTGAWARWMHHLAQAGPWPTSDAWPHLRAREAVKLAEARLRSRGTSRKGYVGLIYADGNAMGRLVQELDSPATCQHFSKLVDDSIYEACYRALDHVCAVEIAQQRAGRTGEPPLPADILLLGGDDLLVLLSADVALTFALHVAEAFEQITRQEIASLPEEVKTFFEKRIGPGRGMTVSCGVALAPAKYPFYLLFDLAEDLLHSAKKGGNDDKDTRQAREAKQSWAPSYIDFHLIVGPAGADLEIGREDDYLVGQQGTPRRTLRPYRREQLDRLRGAVSRLQQAGLPRSKLQDLWAAALDPRPARAGMHARELFGRLRQDRTHQERQQLWLALSDLGALYDFPWCRQGDQEATALADLVEAYDLFPQEAMP